MNTSDSNYCVQAVPSLFQVAEFFEDFFPGARPRQCAESIKHLPVAEYLSNPEKLLALLGAAKTERPPTRAAAASSPDPAKRGARNGSRKSADKTSGKGNSQDSSTGSTRQPGGSPGPVGKTNDPEGSASSNGQVPGSPRKVEFLFTSASANSVKLAGDFTEWQKHAVEMMQSQDGAWSAVIPLAPGSYTYRFIVDGQWCDDPRAQRVANPFGGENSVVHVM